MWPPSSCQIGSRFSAVAKRPNHAAQPTGFRQQPSHGHVGMKQRGENLHERRNSQQYVGVRLRVGNDFRHSDRIRNRWNRDDESRHRPGDAHVEESAPRGKRRANANERAESAEEIRRGNEHRIAHIDSVHLARDVMSHFVGEQNSEQREREGNSRQQNAGCAIGCQIIVNGLSTLENGA